MPTAEFDHRFSDPAAGPTPWEEAAGALERAELYWLTTVRADGRPHVTPLIGVSVDGACISAPGWRSRRRATSSTTTRWRSPPGTTPGRRASTSSSRGRAVRVVDRDALQRLADAYEAKYGSVWHFDVDGDMFVTAARTRRRLPGRAGQGAGLRQGAARPDGVPALADQHGRRRLGVRGVVRVVDRLGLLLRQQQRARRTRSRRAPSAHQNVAPNASAIGRRSARGRSGGTRAAPIPPPAGAAARRSAQRDGEDHGQHGGADRGADLLDDVQRRARAGDLRRGAASASRPRTAASS